MRDGRETRRRKEGKDWRRGDQREGREKSRWKMKVQYFCDLIKKFSFSLDFFYKPHTITLMILCIASSTYIAFTRSSFYLFIYLLIFLDTYCLLICTHR
jgi:hypothetical protein